MAGPIHLLTLLIAAACSWAYHYDPAYIAYNLNANRTARSPTDYWGQRVEGHKYHPSPDNWRMPFYTIFPDRFVNSDPFNDNINGTLFEHDLDSNQMRHGGDVQGLIDSLDYLQGMGIKGLYIAGSIFLNAPWQYDMYSPLDLTLLDAHLGDIDLWKLAVDEIHARGMYVVLDNTFATMGDLIGFDGYLNETAPFKTNEHRAVWKSSRRYLDFDIGNEYNTTCQYPRFYNETGYPVDQWVVDSFSGCYNSDFDQYGDTEAFGVYPDYRRQITKFASVQDRLREWHEPVRLKIENFYCMMIAQLDIDGYRYDKALQSTVDAMGHMNAALRTCAKRFGKDNFFLPGEITGGNQLGSVYLGRGRTPDQLPENITVAITSNLDTQDYSIREPQYAALDGAAFHYSVYRALQRFLGMDGNLAAGYDTPINFVDIWNTFIMTNDMTNANTGEFDPRHMYGVTNQDLFRWPAIANGTQRQLLGHFITTLLLPGSPLLLWGEEQEFYVLDSTANNYIFGRQPLSSASAWQTHGCYSLGSAQYYNWPVESARDGCHDDTVSYDHRDPSAPVHNILKHMFNLRETYPVLQDGAWVQQLSNQTWQVFMPGSSGIETETGLWSVLRTTVPGIQTFYEQEHGNTSVWLIYSNYNDTKTYEFNCSDAKATPHTDALMAPFDSGTTVKNLLYPYDEIKLEQSAQHLGFNGSSSATTGCLSSMKMAAYGYRAYVPIAEWTGPQPMITKFVLNNTEDLGHDSRLLAQTGITQGEEVAIKFYFSTEVNCSAVSESISISSTTESRRSPSFNTSSAVCESLSNVPERALEGMLPSVYSWSAVLEGVEDGVHRITVGNATKNATDHFIFRIGQANNPVVFPRIANYSTTLLHSDEADNLYVQHAAAGADLWRYTTNWGSSYSSWMPYTGGNTSIQALKWSGTDKQKWDGKHVKVEYFSRMAGTSDIVQEGDLDKSHARRFPHLFWNGEYNQYGFDSGLNNALGHRDNGSWRYDFVTEWPTIGQFNVWGMNPDGQPDQSYVMGDVDGDSILDRMPPSALSPAIINITVPPPNQYLGWAINLNDATRRFDLSPIGNAHEQIILFALLAALPIAFAAMAVYAFKRGFYQVKFNQIGRTDNTGLAWDWVKEKVLRQSPVVANTGKENRVSKLLHRSKSFRQSTMLGLNKGKEGRRSVLIGTLEYDIEGQYIFPTVRSRRGRKSQPYVVIALLLPAMMNWKIKVKIGGLGVMAQLMGKALEHIDLIWVIPCVGGVDYPLDTPAEPMKATILGVDYAISVQYHKVKNITYVLLDAPVFRQQSQAEPYPARMDDLTSAIFYSAWNQCIAQAIKRFPIDMYHINDYHGCIAPLYLLPRSIPVCLSLHNAEFQGLWPMRNENECNEVSQVFNLTTDVVQRFVQFGEVFNMLHAGASYLRVYQGGFGAVGVSKKYGRRAHLRYPIFWGLKKVGQLPNPDPTDTATWDGKFPRDEDMPVDEGFEALRPELRKEAQRWAGLEENADAELFVFVGRWSMQKGIDLIADVFPSILKKHPNVQLICIGPVIDLYGKFAALKLEKLMKKYPTRVFSKPVFTQLPPCIFSGAEFALIPSRDEPFGLVAVEFGRKGALGVGARVGGLGNMPGWWYTVEAVTTQHLLDQFRQAIEEALSSKHALRAVMRARSAKQRFPVAQWVENLDILQTTAMRVHGKGIKKGKSAPSRISTASTKVIGGSMESPEANKIDQLLLAPGAIELPRLPFLDRPSSSGPPTPGIETPGISTPGTVTPGAATPGNLTPPILSPDPLASPSENDFLVPPRPSAQQLPSYRSDATLLDSSAITGRRKDYFLQQVDPFFTDTQGTYYTAFSEKLDKSNEMSEGDLCIEQYLEKSEKDWFQLRLNAKLGRESRAIVPTGSETRASSRHRISRPASAIWSFSLRSPATSTMAGVAKQTPLNSDGPFEEFLLGDDYTPPRYLRKWLQLKIYDWPLYTFLLALGQIMAANSYQITLLTGQIGQEAIRVYSLCAIYFVASICFWILFRRMQSATLLAIPFGLYGLAFFFLSVARFAPNAFARGWIQNTSTGLYSAASASGSLYFSLNFGDEGGSTVRQWIFRACAIQGTQQIYIAALWFWGAFLNQSNAKSLTPTGETAMTSFLNSWKLTAICMPIAFALWLIGLAVYYGLPNYYRQIPGRIPSFYQSILRRKIIGWFFITVLVQNFFLSSQYGRSWMFLWSSQHLTYWQVAALVAFFFIVVWIVLLWGFSYMSKSHSWLLPILAIGLGAPRWAQIWWGVSGMGAWLPWTNGYIASALASRALWLWLGLLDTIQNIGIGMILLSTMTRIHVAFTLITAQAAGSVMTAVARACAPNAVGPGPIFPNILIGLSGVANAWFWLGLLLNCGICIGFFMFFRKEQLSKP